MVKRYTCWGDITWRDEAGVDHAPPDGMDVRVVLAADYEAAVNKWQPIETAPINLEVLISDGEYVYSAFRRWRGDGIHEEGWSVGFAWRSPVVRMPTHWMPMPEPPK